MIRPNLSCFGLLMAGLGLLALSAVGCGEKTALPPRPGSGGYTGVVPGTGGDIQGTATSPDGSTVGYGGAILGTGGAGTGGAVPGTGGAVPGTGGAVPGTGGAVPGTGGASAGTGGAVPGTGGASSGTGGGSMASGGSGGSAGCQYPSCLWNLIKDCLVAGPCTEEEAGSDGQSRLCCSNGATEVVRVRTQPSGAINGTVNVTKNGEACYSVTFNGLVGSGVVSANYTWLDPSGQVALKGVLSNPDFVTLTCPDGESVQLATECAPDGSDEAIRTPGVCE